MEKEQRDNKPNKLDSMVSFNFMFQIYDEYGGKDSILPITETAANKEEALSNAEQKIKKILRKNWSFKLIGEKK